MEATETVIETGKSPPPPNVGWGDGSEMFRNRNLIPGPIKTEKVDSGLSLNLGVRDSRGSTT